MDYVQHILAFLATLAGIAGGTWDKDARGWRKLTGSGWVVIAVAFLVAAFGVFKDCAAEATADKRALTAYVSIARSVDVAINSAREFCEPDIHSQIVQDESELLIDHLPRLQTEIVKHSAYIDVSALAEIEAALRMQDMASMQVKYSGAIDKKLGCNLYKRLHAARLVLCESKQAGRDCDRYRH